MTNEIGSIDWGLEERSLLVFTGVLQSVLPFEWCGEA